MKSILAAFTAFLGAVPHSFAGVLVQADLNRAILTAVGASSVLGLVVSVLTAISSDAAHIFPSPAVATSVSFAIGLVVDLLRRIDHDPAEPSAPVAQVVPAPEVVSRKDDEPDDVGLADHPRALAPEDVRRLLNPYRPQVT